MVKKIYKKLDLEEPVKKNRINLYAESNSDEQHDEEKVENAVEVAE